MNAEVYVSYELRYGDEALPVKVSQDDDSLFIEQGEGTFVIIPLTDAGTLADVIHKVWLNE